jgi:outer membrane lipoprotein SlyB
LVNSMKEVSEMKVSRMHWVALMSAIVAIVQPAFAGEKPIKNQNFVVNLTSPISTKDSKAGDTFTAQVLEPAEFQGSVIEGHVRKVEPAQNGEAPKAHINFAFETLTVGDTTYKIQADLQEVVNSKGIAKVDEEGQVIAKGNAGKRAMAGLGGAGIGAFAGGMLGGGMGSLIGGAIGGAAGYIISLDVTASSHNIEFYPGTHFTLQVNSKGIDKSVKAEQVRQQEAAAEAAMAAHAAQPAPSPTPSPELGPTPSPSPTPTPNAADPGSARTPPSPNPQL